MPLWAKNTETGFSSTSFLSFGSSQSLTPMNSDKTKQVYTQFSTPIQKMSDYNGLIPLDNNKREFCLKA